MTPSHPDAASAPRRPPARLLARMGLPALLLAGATPANAELTGNVGVTNNYLWRGITQTNDAPAVSGGIDYAHDSGLYAGTWLSNVDFATPGDGESGTPEVRSEYEQDWYLGYGGEAGVVTYDLGYTLFSYPLSDDADFGEVYGALGYSILNVHAAYTVHSQVADTAGAGERFLEGDLYYSATLDVPLTEDFSVAATYGHYGFDDRLAESYNHYSLYLGKGDFRFGVEANDTEGEFPAGKDASEPRVVAAWSHTTDLL